MDKLKQLESFVAVATKGSLTATALAEGVAPAVIGRRIEYFTDDAAMEHAIAALSEHLRERYATVAKRWAGGAVPADPATAAMVGAFLATYCTFLPSFLFILAGAPYVEGLHANKAVSAALAAITAAIVGVILNLAVFLGQEVFLPKTGPDLIAIAVAAIAFAASVRFNPPIHYMVAGGAAYGIARMLAGL